MTVNLSNEYCWSDGEDWQKTNTAATIEAHIFGEIQVKWSRKSWLPTVGWSETAHFPSTIRTELKIQEQQQASKIAFQYIYR